MNNVIIFIKQNNMENVVVHCRTENEAQELLRFLYKKGFTWSSGLSLIGRSYWHI